MALLPAQVAGAHELQILPFVVNSVNPTSGPTTGGTQVTISGTDLATAVSVTFGGAGADFTIVSNTQIDATTPPNPDGPVDVVVTEAFGSVTDTGAFTYYDSNCRPPTVTSANAATAQAGSQFTFTVTTCSTKAPVISASHLPNGLSLVDHKNGTATISGTPAAEDSGLYKATLTAAVRRQSLASQSFQVTVHNAAVFTSSPGYSVRAGLPFSFPITTRYGSPEPTIAASSLPTGVSLTDLGNGTATLAGTPDPSVSGVYTISLTASNTVGRASQAFALTVRPAEGTAPKIGQVTFSANPSPYGQPITITGTITDPAGQSTPTGTVTLIEQNTRSQICSLSLTPVSQYTAGVTCTLMPAANSGIGMKIIIRALYTGDSDIPPTQGSATVVEAGTGSTSVSVSAHPATVPAGSATTLTAALTGNPEPTGTVTFLANGNAIPGCGRIVVHVGVSTSNCAYTPAAPGTASITATYSGNIFYASAGPSAAVSLNVT